MPENLATDEQRLRRFEREALAASALNHPNILTIYEFGAEAETHFLAAEFIEGETLREAIKRNELNFKEILSIAEQTAFALSAAHQSKIVHRDIKPENIMIRADGIVKVLDFGLAKLTENNQAIARHRSRDAPACQNQSGAVMGTAAYMSPEQARGRSVDERTDIWSLGVVIYEMLTGKIPFGGETASAKPLIFCEKPPNLTRKVPSAYRSARFADGKENVCGRAR